MPQSSTLSAQRQKIHVGHSPDPDDAFMFHALANGKIDTGRYDFEHELVDIETLNRRAFAGELELTAVSLHAYAHLTDKYLLCPCGASMGDGYGPMVSPATRPRSTRPAAHDRRARHADHGLSGPAAVPGPGFRHVVVPFDQIIDAVEAGEYAGTTDRSRPDHPRRATDLRRPRSEAGRRPGPLVVRPDRPAACRWGPTPSARIWAPRRSAT